MVAEEVVAFEAETVVVVQRRQTEVPELALGEELPEPTKAPSTLTCPRGSGRGASYIINGGVLLIFVPNH